MPRSKEGKTREKIDPQALENAVNDVLTGYLRVNEAAQRYGLSNSTVSRHYKTYLSSGVNEDEPHFVYDSEKNAVKRVFTNDEELRLVSYLKQSAALHYGLTKKDTLKLAFQYASSLAEQPNSKTQVPNEWATAESAGEFWLRGFRKRHPSLSLRKPEATSLARATSFNKENIKSFFDNLQLVMERHKFQANDIYNLDETGNSTVHEPPKILCTKGTKQVGSVTSGERGLNVTMIACINAIGNSIPPMLIFPRVNFKQHMLIGAPNGSIGGANPSGWSTEGLFVDFMKHFIRHVKPTTDKPVLLILDNHETHISIESLNLAKENGVVMLTFPPHTSHKLQPLDRTVFGPYKGYYNSGVSGWMLSNPGRPVQIYDVAGLIGSAYNKAFTKENIEKGFKVTGIFPFLRDIFTDDEFLSSYVTDRELIDKNTNVIASEKTQSPTNENVLDFPAQPVQPLPSNSDLQIASTSRETPEIVNQIVTPEMIRPFPKAASRKKTSRGRQPGKTRILTDTPEKKEIEEQKKMKNKRHSTLPKQLYHDRKKKKSNPKKRNKVKTVDTSSSEDDQITFLSDEEEDDMSMEGLIQGVLEEEMNIALQDNIECVEIKKDDYVLVKLAGKKKILYYVAKVINKVGVVYEIQYLVKTGENTFISRDKTIYGIDEEEIICKLPTPLTTGSSERLKQSLKFPVNFTAYDMPMD
jgi:transposase-like protein